MYITQNGKDGFGHQIFGIASLLAKAKQSNGNIKYVVVPHHGIFEHLCEEEKKEVTQYIDEALHLFYLDNKDICVRKEELNEKEKIISEDSSWKEYDNGKYIKQLNLKKYFINKFIPKNNLHTDKKNIVIHIRGGDASHRVSGIFNPEYRSMLILLIRELEKKYPHAFITIHTNSTELDTNSFDIKNEHQFFFENDVSLLTVFSDLINSDIFVVGDSALSSMACYLKDRELTIYPTKLSSCLNENHKKFDYAIAYHYYENSITISKFLRGKYIVQKIKIMSEKFKRTNHTIIVKILGAGILKLIRQKSSLLNPII